MSDEQRPYEGSEPQRENPSSSPHQSPAQSPYQAAAVPPYQADTTPYQAEKAPSQTTVPPYQADVPPRQTTVPPYQAEVPPYQTATPPHQPTMPPYQAEVPPYQSTVPPYQSMEPPYQNKQFRRWPWILLGIAIGIVIGFGGCASCTLGTLALSAYNDRDYPYYDYDYDYNYPYDEGIDPDIDGSDPYDYLDELLNNDGDWNATNTYTFDEIRSFYDMAEGTFADGHGTAGIYRVGRGEELEPGMYYLEGSQDRLSEFAVYTVADSDATSFEAETQNVYLGNYFVELNEGDVFVFVPDGNETFRAASSEPLGVSSPYQSGMYRVGIDIPAGTYQVRASTEADVGDSREAAAFIYNGLASTSYIADESFYVMPGGHHDITVRDGQYLELFGAQATPVDE